MPQVIGAVTKAFPTDNYPVVDDNDVAGGFKIIPTLLDRDSIVSNVIKEGSLIYVLEDGHYYKMGAGLTPIDWVDLGTSLGGGGDAFYTSLSPAAVTVGGLELGQEFVNVSFQDLIEQMLHPYLFPTFSSFAITGQVGLLEVGDIIPLGLKTFTWTTTNPSNINVDSVKIVDVTDAVDLAIDLTNDGNEDITFPLDIQKVVQASHVFRIEAINSRTQVFNRTLTINWNWRFYWGFYAPATIDSANVLLLQSSKLTTTRSGTIAMPTNGGTNYIYIAYRASFGLITQIQDLTNSFNVTNDFIFQGVLSHTNSFNVTLDYNVYRSVNATGGASGFNYSIS